MADLAGWAVVEDVLPGWLADPDDPPRFRRDPADPHMLLIEGTVYRANPMADEDTPVLVLPDEFRPSKVLRSRVTVEKPGDPGMRIMVRHHIEPDGRVFPSTILKEFPAAKPMMGLRTTWFMLGTAVASLFWAVVVVLLALR